MKKGIVVVLCFISSSVFCSPVPNQVQEWLLSKAWNGFMTNDSTGGANGFKQMTLNFARDEEKRLNGTITIYGVKVGNGVFNVSEFLAVDYLQGTPLHDDGILSLSYLDPTSRLNRDTFTLKATELSGQVMTGLLYISTDKGSFKIGTFRVTN